MEMEEGLCTGETGEHYLSQAIKVNIMVICQSDRMCPSCDVLRMALCLCVLSPQN